MGPQARWEYMKVIYARYRDARSRDEKGRILDEFCKTYRCHRKHALRVLNGPEPAEQRPRRKSAPSAYGSPRLHHLLEQVWQATGNLCGQRLTAAMPVWMPWIKARLNASGEEQRLLLAMSSATIDRRLRAVKQTLKRRIYGTTRPGSLLKHHIPIKTDCWDVDRPGYMEVDLVSHSGDCAEGDFAHTLNMTDVYTGWVERRCVLGKSQRVVLEAIDSIRKDLPFALLGLDSDNGSEFVNHHLWNYCRRSPQIQFTRGRPYKKDDNAHIEQKNWTHVRKLLGYARYDRRDALGRINRLYRCELRWFQNLFLPSMRLVRKTRIGSKLRRVYDAPKTPLQRVIESRRGINERVSALAALQLRSDPFALSQLVERSLGEIWALRSKAPRPRWNKRGHLPDYENKVPIGAPLTPTPFVGIEPYEKILSRETARQTW